jgi:hypothetical protein
MPADKATGAKPSAWARDFGKTISGENAKEINDPVRRR